jgi:Flp pilus assembly protein TadD
VGFGGEAYSADVEGDIFQRAAFLNLTDCKADVVMGLTAQRDRHADSVVSPFSHTLLVQNTKDDTATATVLARSLARLFGVPVSARTLVLAGADQGMFDEASIQLIRDMRGYDFANGISALPGRWETHAADALAKELKASRPDAEAEAHHILGGAFAQGRRPEDAIREYRQAIQMKPGDAKLHFELALQLEANLELQAAIQELNEAAKLEPSDAPTHAATGAFLLRANHNDEAIAEFRQAVSLEPRDASYRAALGTALARQAGHNKDAAEAFQAAVRLRPLEPGALVGLSRANSVQESLDQATRMLEAETRKQPDSAQAHLELGVTEARNGNFETAQKEMRRAIELKPSDATAHLALARTYVLVGKYAEAESEVHAARSLGTTPPNALVEDLERKLGRKIAQ